MASSSPVSERIRRQWEALGASDPYWAVLTHPDKRGGKWDRNAFFESGSAEIAEVEARLAALGLQPARRVALDYGCGVGRLSRALATRFDRVIGVDISRTMLDEARAANSHAANIDFRRGTGRNLDSIDDASIDFLYSNIVLQHTPVDDQRALIREFCRVLAPGGTLVFQAPARANMRTLHGIAQRVLGNGVLNIARRAVYGPERVMELHAIRRVEVLTLLADGGLDLVANERYDSAGRAFVSYLYIATRSRR